MKEQYFSNIYILTKIIVEELEKDSHINKLRIGIKAAYRGIGIMLVGFCIKICWNKFYPMLDINYVYQMIGWMLLVACFLVAAIEFDKAYHFTIDKKLTNSEWLNYINIPMIGKAKHWGNQVVESYEFENKVDFTVLKRLLDKDYIYYIIFYEDLLKETKLSCEERKYMLMMNLIAALKEEKGIRNRLEKWLLAGEIRKIYKAKNKIG